MEEYIMTIDEGTTSARAVLFNKDSEIIAICAKEFAQYYPQPGWVEQDPKEIWLTTKEVINRVVLQAGIDPRQIKAAGITNQRETVVVYDKNTGEPVYNAIGWADRRTAPYCDELKAAGKEQMFIDKTGLLIDGYFSGTEIKWILDNVPGAREKAEAGDLYFLILMDGSCTNLQKASAILQTTLMHQERSCLIFTLLSGMMICLNSLIFQSQCVLLHFQVVDISVQ